MVPEPNASDSLLTDIASRFAALSPSDTRSTFRKALEKPFAQLLQSELIQQRLQRALERLAADPMALPRVPVTRRLGATLCPEAPCVGVSLVQPATARTITGTPRHRFVGCLAGRVEVTRYVPESDRDPAVLDRDCGLRSAGVRVLDRGEFDCFEAWRDVTEFDGRGVLLQLHSPLCHTTRWAYDRRSLKPVALVAAERSLGRIDDALQMLRRIGTAGHAVACEKLLDHESHVVRWEAVRVACALGHKESRRLVENATRDSHPHVREAATRAMAAFVSVS